MKANGLVHYFAVRCEARKPGSCAPRASVKHPRNTLARYYLGEAWLRVGRPDEAARAWTQTLAGDSRYVPAAEALGGGDRARARSYLEQALAMDPDDYLTLFELGIVERQMGETAASRRHLEAACRIALNPVPCQRKIEAPERKQDAPR